MADRGITDDSIDKFKLGVDTGNGQLTIPYLTPAGPWLVKYRCLADHEHEGHGKYWYDTGAGLHLFNAPVLATAELAVIVEGELDAIAVSQLDIAAVGYPGASQWKAHPHWRWCFDSVDDIIVVADGDEPGKKAATGVAESLRSAVNGDVHLVILPDGEDSNSFINQFGSSDYLERLDLL